MIPPPFFFNVRLQSFETWDRTVFRKRDEAMNKDKIINTLCLLYPLAVMVGILGWMLSQDFSHLWIGNRIVGALGLTWIFYYLVDGFNEVLTAIKK